MLVGHEKPVETDRQRGRQRQAEGERSDEDRNRSDPRSPLPQLQSLEVPLRAACHHEGEQTEQERQRNCIAGVQ